MPEPIRVDVELNASSAIQQWRAFLAELRKTFPTTQQMEKALQDVEDLMKGLTKAGQRNTEQFKQALSVWRGLTQIYGENVDAAKEVEKQQKAITKAGDPKQIESVIAANEALIQSYKQQYTTIEQVDAQLTKLRAELSAIRNSEEASTQAGQDAIRTKQQQVNALEQVRSELVKLRNETNAAASAQEKLSHRMALQIKQTLLWIAGSASAYYVFRKLRNEIEQGIKDVYGQTDAYKALQEATTDLRNGLVIALLGGSDFQQTLDAIADTLNSVTQSLLRTNAAWEASEVELDVIIGKYKELNPEAASLVDTLRKVPSIRSGMEMGAEILRYAEQLGIIPDTWRLADTQLEAYNAELEDSNSLLNTTTDLLEKATSAAAKLADHARDVAQAQRESAAAFAAAQQAYLSVVGTATTPGTARGNLAAEQMRIQTSLANQINQINANALQQRTNAYANYQQQIADMQRQAQRQEQADAERHALEMEYAARRHQLDMIQNERIYQYSREQLVAEGDVLAIEDLDARYELERQAQEENYQLQQEQAEAMYQLQSRLQQEAMREQMQALQSALAEQLRGIEQARRDEIAEAEAAAAEKQRAALDAYAQELIDAQVAHAEAKAEQAKAAAEQLQDEAEFRAKFLIEHNLTIDQITTIWKEGNAELNALTVQTFNEMTNAIKALTPGVVQAFDDAGAQAGAAFANKIIASMTLAKAAMAGVTSSVGSYGSSGSYMPRDYFPGQSFGFQHGGEMIVSQPTMMKMGEHGVSERVTVQPLSSIGGNIGVSWQGGAIPLHGTGSLTGADVGAMSGVFNQLLRSFAMEYVKQRGSIRGQRGR